MNDALIQGDFWVVSNIIVGNLCKPIHDVEIDKFLRKMTKIREFKNQ